MTTRHRGTILIVVMLIIAALAGMVLVLGRTSRVEAMTSANHVAGSKAAAVERAAEQYVVAMLAQQRAEVLTLEQSSFEAVPVGDAGMFWIVRPDYGDSTMPMYGLVDEASKINLNTGNRLSDMLLLFPSVPEELAYSITDWRDGNSDLTPDGAEDQYYLALPTPYRCKNSSLETVEELLLVRGATRELLYGDGTRSDFMTTSSGGRQLGGLDDAEIAARGLYNYFTVYSREPAVGQTRARTGRINLNTASREVIRCIPGMTDSDASTLVSKRGSQSFGTPGLTWANEILGSRAGQLQNVITGESYQFSADIVAASSDGRSFRHVRIVVDASDAASRPKIVYRHDSTSRGWPLDPNILASLRSGNGSMIAGRSGQI